MIKYQCRFEGGVASMDKYHHLQDKKSFKAAYIIIGI